MATRSLAQLVDVRQSLSPPSGGRASRRGGAARITSAWPQRILAHELRTPLASMQATLEVLGDLTASDDEVQGCSAGSGTAAIGWAP